MEEESTGYLGNVKRETYSNSGLFKQKEVEPGFQAAYPKVTTPKGASSMENLTDFITQYS